MEQFHLWVYTQKDGKQGLRDICTPHTQWDIKRKGVVSYATPPMNLEGILIIIIHEISYETMKNKKEPQMDISK